MNESEKDFPVIEIDLKPIKGFAEKIGRKYAFIRSIYLFGSVAYGNANKESDLDILILIEGNPAEILLILTNDENYKKFEDWSFSVLEGGLNTLICNKKELVNNFDTLIEKILKDGIFLYGADLKQILNQIFPKNKKNESDLLKLVRSL